MIAIIDYDIGNLAAVANMLHRIGVESEVTANPERIKRAQRIVLPGNGAFDACMRNLRLSGLIPLLEEKVFAQRVPLLGICVGAQMLGTGSEEGEEPGLGWLKLRVRRFPAMPGLKVPHMGWNQVVRGEAQHALAEGLTEQSRFYFVHSYYMEPEHTGDVLLRATYGLQFAAAVANGNISGVQFHPEKSHRYGKQLLGNFARLQ